MLLTLGVESQHKGAKKKAKKSKQPTKNRLNTGINSLGGTTKEPRRSSEEESIDNSNKRAKAKVTVILGDSIVKNIQGHKLGKVVGHRVVVRPFPGATTEDDMRHYIKPTLDKSPDQILLHAGTNDLKNLQPNEVADKVADLVCAVDKTTIVVSELTTRGDSLENSVKAVNRRLKQLCLENDWKCIRHDNITNSGLNRGGLHLNKEGNDGTNFASALRD